MPKRPKQTRNWHAVNAFNRHAGPMHSVKRASQSQQKQVDDELQDCQDDEKPSTGVKDEGKKRS